ncbi:hypothetical protein [Halobacterium yunchengense]|uniref:hypothetical protein n=1 Tax=Halobacterium yunchengense TaxID=3108497 RepID=UPI00300A5FFE
MERATKDALAWGATGALAFLVLAQAYRFVADAAVGFLPLLGVAAVVFAVAAAASHRLAGRLA